MYARSVLALLCLLLPSGTLDASASGSGSSAAAQPLAGRAAGAGQRVQVSQDLRAHGSGIAQREGASPDITSGSSQRAEPSLPRRYMQQDYYRLGNPHETERALSSGARPG